MDDDTDERSGLAELNKRVDCPGLKEPMHLYAMEKVIPTGYFKTMAQVRMSNIERMQALVSIVNATGARGRLRTGWRVA